MLFKEHQDHFSTVRPTSITTEALETDFEEVTQNVAPHFVEVMNKHPTLSLSFVHSK